MAVYAVARLTKDVGLPDILREYGVEESNLK